MNTVKLKKLSKVEKRKTGLSEYEYLGMVCYNGVLSTANKRKFLYVLAKENKVLLYCFARIEGGYYIGDRGCIAPVIEEDIEFTNYVLDNEIEVRKEIKIEYTLPELALNREEIFVFQHENSGENITKNFYIENKSDILELVNCKELDETSELFHEERNIYASYLEQLVVYHDELIKIFTGKRKNIKIGHLGIQASGRVYIYLGKIRYKLQLERVDGRINEYEDLPKEIENYHTYLSVKTGYSTDVNVSLKESLQDIKENIKNGNIEKYLYGIKVEKEPISATKTISVLETIDINYFEKIEFDLINSEMEYLHLEILNAYTKIDEITGFRIIRR